MPTRAACLTEDGLRQQRADDVLTGVDDLGDLEIDDQAAEHVGILAPEVVAARDVVDHRADGVLCRDVEVPADAGRGIESGRVHAPGQRRGSPVLRCGDRAVLVEAQAQLIETLDRVGSQDWSRQSPNEGWTVRDLLTHLTTSESGFVNTTYKIIPINFLPAHHCHQNILA